MRIEDAAGPISASNAVNLSGATITDANLSGVAFTKATLTGMTIDGILVTDLLRAARG